MPRSVESGYAAVNGASVYWESRGQGGTPLLLVPGGYGIASDFDAVADVWSRDRRVIGLELDGHGHSRASGGSCWYPRRTGVPPGIRRSWPRSTR